MKLEIVLCVQTSGLPIKPHQSFLKTRSFSCEPEIKKGKCWCVAGLSKVEALVRGVAPLLQVRYLTVFDFHRQLCTVPRVAVYHIASHNI